jgi:hypothetical protein
MRIRRASLILGLLLAGALATCSVVGAANVRVTGTITEGSPGVCSGFALQGETFSFHCDGMTETWTGGVSGIGVFSEDLQINVVSGELHGSGTETLTGCVGTDCGTLDWVFHGSGKFDLQTLTVIFFHGEQHFTGGAGDLAGASGSVRFSDVGTNPGSYQGSVVI